MNTDNVKLELLSMGFQERLIDAAMGQCPHGSLEDLVSCILVLSDDSTLPPSAISVSTRVEGMKMVLVVRSDLGMSAGKVAAQCVHGALGAVRVAEPSKVRAWELGGESTICLRCDNADEMNNLRSRTAEACIPCYIVCDAGRTEVSTGSQTVLAIGPESISRIDEITKYLKLY